ncbi:MAG: RagB/SusD family nutrient uptake outer membrane protein [Ilyomonas sp.]
MNKHRFKIFIALSLVLVAFACNKKLDVLPQNNVTPEQIQTAEDVKAVLFGGYGLMQRAGGFGEQYLLIADLLASQDNVNWVGTFTNYKEIQRKKQLKDNALPLNIWQNSYLTILNANTVLDKLDLLSADEKDAIEGEAKFIRGVCYYELINFFAPPYAQGNVASLPGVPIVLQPVYDYDSTKDKPSRATVEAVYNQIISDLSDAAQKLPETNGIRASKYAAEAFLARVYMNMNDYAKAAEMANDVISSGQYALASSFDKAFNNESYSPEDIFAIAQTVQSNAGTSNNGLTTFYSPKPPEGVGRGDAQIDPEYFSMFDNENDQRYNYYVEGVGFAGIAGYYTDKWIKFYKYIPVVRLAEMYLTRGEANLRKGGAPTGGVSPLDDINIVRERSGGDALQNVTGNDFVDERLRELAFEGDRVWTLKRLKMNIDGLAYNDPKLVLPIPQAEIDVNNNLQQNQGY